MRWYLNDLSLQGQFNVVQDFEDLIRAILASRARITSLRSNLWTTKTLRERLVSPTLSVRDAIQRSKDIDFRRAVLGWLDKNGPFTEDDRFAEADDYFEYEMIDVTESGLGEAARRARVRQPVATFSFAGGAVRFDFTPLYVDHGLDEDRLGRYAIENFWSIGQLIASAYGASRLPTSWKELVEAARERFPRLVLPDSLYEDDRVAREPFDAAIRDRALSLLGLLDSYMSDRLPNGAEGPLAQQVIKDYFVGDRALFSGESVTNQREFRKELTFADSSTPGGTIFAHWHGKISHRFFRVHFEWPVPTGATVLKVTYLGPKITRS